VIPAGLSAATLRSFQLALTGHHEIRVRVNIQDLAGNSLGNVSDRLVDGQVNVDADAEVTRSASFTLLDPDRALPFDSTAPTSAALYLDRMMHASYDVLVGGSFVQIPVFTGPVTKLSRSDTQVVVEAQGKEALAMGAIWTPLTLPKGMPKLTALSKLLRDHAGETLFSIPGSTAKLSGPLSIPRSGRPWDFAQRIARSMNRQLYYSGDGVCRMRTVPGTSMYTFTDQHLTSRAQISYTTDNLANIVHVTGKQPAGPTTVKGATEAVMAAPTALAVAPASHPLSPLKLGRNGVARYLLLPIQDDSIGTISEAQALADLRLAQSLLQSVDASFTTIPVPHLDPLDMCTLASASASTTFALRQFSLPLVAGPDMTVGWLKNLAVRPRKVNATSRPMTMAR
jgi:hypothetical protein